MGGEISILTLMVGLAIAPDPGASLPGATGPAPLLAGAPCAPPLCVSQRVQESRSEPHSGRDRAVLGLETEAPVSRSAVPPSPAWPRVEIEDPFTRDAVVTALNGATAWLEGQGCLSLFDELRDDEGRPLMESLRQWKLAPTEYLRMVWFRDGERHRVCGPGRVLAFTARRSRVVFLCGRRFARAAARDPQEARATVIHELLHTLGLGENPPSPRDITDRVKRRCWG
jgi:hypothetical protein